MNAKRRRSPAAASGAARSGAPPSPREPSERHVVARAGVLDVADRFASRHGTAIVLGQIAVYVAVYFAACVGKYRDYLYRDFDLAIFVQAVDRMLHGSFYSSIRGMHWLGDHSSLILFLVAPIYAVFRSPLTLLGVQTLALGLGALAVHRLARREVSGGLAAVGFAALYLLHPAIGYLNLYEFHPEALATSLLMFAFEAVRAGRLAPAVGCAAAALLCKEDVALVVMALGVYALTVPGRRYRVASALVAIAMVSLVVSFGVFKPALNVGEAAYGDMYAHWGATVGEVVVNVLTHPIDAAAAFFVSPTDPQITKIKLLYHVQMLLPLLFLPLLSPATLAIGLPALAAHFLSWRFQQQTIVFQYTALIIPFVVGAAVVGTGNLERWTAGARGRSGRETSLSPERDRRGALARPLVLVVLCASLVSGVLFGPLRGRAARLPVLPTESLGPDSYDRTLRPHRDRLVAAVPREVGVVTAFEFLARFAARAQVHSLHHVIRGQYTFSSRPYPVPTGIGALIADMSDPGVLPYQGPESGRRMQTLLRTNGLRPAGAAGDLVLFLSNPRDTVELYASGAIAAGTAHPRTFDGQLRLEAFEPVRARVAPGGEVVFRTQWRRVAEIDRLYFMDVSLVDAEGTVHYAHRRVLGYGIYPPREWLFDTAMRETGRLLIPVNVAPGAYSLVIGLQWRSAAGNGRAVPAGPAEGDGAIELGRIDVGPARGVP